MSGTQTEDQLGLYCSRPADLSAVTVTTGGTYYMVGYSNGPGSSLINNTANYAAGVTQVTLDATTNFYVGEAVTINAGASTAEVLYVSAISSPKLTFTTPTIFPHNDEEPVIGSSAAFTPTYTGRLFITCEGDLTGNNTGDVIAAKIVKSSAISAAPSSAGGAAAGTVIGNIANVTSLTGVLTQPFSCVAMLGGPAATDTKPSGGAALTVGTPYWFDLQVTTTTSAKTVQATNVTWQIQEF
jgi:hypothetical protein